MAFLVFSYYGTKTNKDENRSGADENKIAVIEPATDKTAEEKIIIEPEPMEKILPEAEDVIKEAPPAAAEVGQTEKKPSSDTFSAIAVESLERKDINSKSIVAVQCLWDYTYSENVYEDPRFHESLYSQGSGVVVSSSGHILTANHVVDNKITREKDPTGKKWFLEKCEAAPTDESASPLPYNSPRFKEVEIIFQPTTEEFDYNSEERTDFDIALLKFRESEDYPFTQIFGSLVDSDLKEEPLFFTGYPAAALTGKREPKTLEFFSSLEKYRGIGVGVSALFYQAGSRKFSAASESYKQFQKDLFASGQDERLVRGGFSGSPVFARGNLIGIVIASTLPYAEQEDMMIILSSYSINELLKKHNL